MIIWGWRARDRQIATGIFHCPGCRASGAYTHRQVARYFTLYFIPLFPTATLGEYVRCLRCGGEFKPVVLTLSQQEVDELVKPWPCGNCGNHNPAAETHCVACGARKGYVRPAPADEVPAADPGFAPPTWHPATTSGG